MFLIIWYNFIGLTNAFAKGAKINGASILEDCPVAKINLNSDNVVQSVTVGTDNVSTTTKYTTLKFKSLATPFFVDSYK